MDMSRNTKFIKLEERFEKSKILAQMRFFIHSTLSFSFTQLMTPTHIRMLSHMDQFGLPPASRISHSQVLQVRPIKMALKIAQYRTKWKHISIPEMLLH